MYSLSKPPLLIPTNQRQAHFIQLLRAIKRSYPPPSSRNNNNNHSNLLGHPVGNLSEDALHHRQVLPIVVRLEQGDAQIKLKHNTTGRDPTKEL